MASLPAVVGTFLTVVNQFDALASGIIVSNLGAMSAQPEA
jgi:hypothetical protein